MQAFLNQLVRQVVKQVVGLLFRILPRFRCYRCALGNGIVFVTGVGPAALSDSEFGPIPHSPFSLSATPFAPRSLLGSPLIRRGLNSAVAVRLAPP